MKFVKPKVFLIAETQMTGMEHPFLSHVGATGWNTDAPSDAEKLTEIAGKTCYMSFDKKLNKNLTRVRENRNRDYIQEGLIKVGHESVLEHSSVTFAICDVSRVFTHELVRHRVGCAYSQVSGRYVRVEGIEAYKPKHLTDRENISLAMALEKIEILYKDLEAEVFERVGNDFDTKKKATSAIRRMLPNGQGNHIIFTANHRVLRHIIQMRTSEHAEEEIKEVFDEILVLLKSRHPNIYEDLGDKK
jgi:thymidylate synthase (FAD)